MDYIIEKFKKMNTKNKAVVIAVAVLILIIIFGRLKSSFSKKTPEPVTTTAVTTETTTQPITESTTEKETESETEAETEKAEENTEAEETENTKAGRVGIRKEFKEFWDSYVKFMDSYVKATKDPGSAEYIRALADYVEFTDKAAEWEDEDDLSDEEMKYMTAAQAKIAAKYIEAAWSN